MFRIRLILWKMITYFRMIMKIAETFKIFFENAVKNLNVLGDSDSLSSTFHLDNPVDIAVEKFKNLMSMFPAISFSRR